MNNKHKQLIQKLIVVCHIHHSFVFKSAISCITWVCILIICMVMCQAFSVWEHGGDGISSKPAIFIKTGLRKVVPTNEIIVGGFKILYVELNPVFFWHLIVSHSGANSNTISAEITTTVGHPEAEVWNKYGFSLQTVI